MTCASVSLLRARDVDYDVALRWQRATAEAVRGGGPEALALIEHRPVYTMGRRGGRASLAVPPGALRAPVVDVERGGDITWHGPGQLVGYPILDLRRRSLRPADYVHRLEAMLIDVLATFTVEAGAVPGRPGVWVGGQKVAAIGVAVRGGVTMHGFALNVAPDLGWFDAIVPCGIRDATVTSLARLLPVSAVGVVPDVEAVAAAVAAAFESHFDVALREEPATALRAASAAAEVIPRTAGMTAEVTA